MGNAISSASLILSTNSAKLSSGLKSAGGMMTNWASSTTASMGKKLSSGFSGALGGIKGGVVGLVTGLGLGALTGGVEKIKELAKEGKAAKSLGVDSGQYMGLATAFSKAGVEGEEFNKTMAKLGAKTNEAAGGNAQLSGLFKSLGLDAKELITLPIDTQLLMVSDAMAKLGPGAGQSAAAMKLFEEAGVKLLPILGQGSEKLQGMIDAAKASGQALSQAEMDKVMSAQSALPKIQAAWDGLSNRIIVAVAPIIEMIGGKLTQALTALQPVFTFISEYFDEAFSMWGDILGEAWDAIKEVGTAVLDLIGPVFEFSGATVKGGDIAFKVFKFLGQGIGYVWDTFKAGAGIVAVVVGSIVQALGFVLEKISGVLQALKELPSSIKPDWVDGAVDGFARVASGVKATGKDIKGWGVDAVSSFGETSAKVGAWFDKKKAERDAKIKNDRDGGFVGDALKGGGAGAGKREVQPIGGLAGSKEAAESIARFMGGNVKNPAVDVAKKQLAANNQGNKILQDISNGIKDMASVAVNVF